ncbi:hypothetical protein [Halovenus sp. HT40]|uniref:hypothetical protein n=1 Tax=Halovenus sp. HT40 TaxID=3126691 RepID=UPI00300F6307
MAGIGPGVSKGWLIWQHDPIAAGEVQYENGTVEVQGEVEQLEVTDFGLWVVPLAQPSL